MKKRDNLGTDRLPGCDKKCEGGLVDRGATSHEPEQHTLTGVAPSARIESAAEEPLCYLELSQARLRSRVLALHIINVCRAVLALVVVRAHAGYVRSTSSRGEGAPPLQTV